MSLLLKILALSWMIFTGWVALTLIIGMGHAPLVWFGVLPRELAEHEIFMLSAVVLLVVSVLALIFGGPYMDKQLGARKPSPREMDVLNQVIDRLKEAYQARFKSDIPALTWRVLDDNSYNAMAYGRGSIAVSRALIALARDNGQQGVDGLLGVAAHELGHIEHRDTVFPLVMSAVAWPLRFVHFMFIIFLIIPYVGRIIFDAIGYFFAGVELAGWLLLGASSKPGEYKADKFAAELVGPDGLVSFFDLIGPMDINAGGGLLGHYLKSHPPVELRRARVEQFHG